MSAQTKQLPVFSRFVAVGLMATLIYAGLALFLNALFSDFAGQAPVSLLAYALAAVFSYSAHRLYTFVSNGAYRFEIPRFVLLTLAGAMISFVVPVVANNWLQLPMYISVAVVCIAVPLVNYFLLDRWVFANRGNGS